MARKPGSTPQAMKNRAAKTAGNVNTNTLTAQAQSTLYGALHRTTERNTTLKLIGNTFRDQFCINFGFAYF